MPEMLDLNQRSMVYYNHPQLEKSVTYVLAIGDNSHHIADANTAKPRRTASDGASAHRFVHTTRRFNV
jgi:hypothetical protein